jgi:hypothetical protein
MPREYSIIVFSGSQCYGSSFFGAEIDFSQSCSDCLSNSTRIGPPIAKASELKDRRIIQSASSEWFCREDLRDLILSAKLTGVNFEAVRHPGRSAGSRYFEFRPTSVVPKFDETSIVDRKSVCGTCGRGAYGWPTAGKKIQIEYTTDFPFEFDFYNTWEQFGGTVRRDPLRLSYVPKPLVIVSQKARDLFKTFCERSIEFVPVAIKTE